MEYEIDLPSVSHIETVIDGVVDSINGNESYATRYNSGVLYASGIITKKDFNSVSGNEGFMSSIKDGTMKIIEYIKNLVKTIWNFLFKSKDEIKETEKQLDQLNKDLRAMVKVNYNTGLELSKEIDKHLKTMTIKEDIKVLTKLDKAKEIISEYKQSTGSDNPPKEAVNLVKEVKVELVSEATQQLVEKSRDSWNRSLSELDKLYDDWVTELRSTDDDTKSSVLDNGKKVLSKELKNTLTYLSDFSNHVSDLTMVKRYLDLLEVSMFEIKAVETFFSNSKGKIENRLKELEKDKSEDKEKLNKTAVKLKNNLVLRVRFLTFSSSMIKLIKKNISELQKTIN